MAPVAERFACSGQHKLKPVSRFGKLAFLRQI